MNSLYPLESETVDSIMCRFETNLQRFSKRKGIRGGGRRIEAERWAFGIVPVAIFDSGNHASREARVRPVASVNEDDVKSRFHAIHAISPREKITLISSTGADR